MIINSSLQYNESTIKCISFLISHPTYCIDLLSSEYPFALEQLLRYSDILNWSMVSSNTNIKWDFDLIFDLYDKISWKDFTINSAAFNDVSLLSIFSEEIHNSSYSIASNYGLPWTLEFIQKYESKIDFKKLSQNSSVKWSEELIDKYWGKWDVKELGYNEAIPWDLRLFDKYLGEKSFEDIFIRYNQRISGNFDIVEKYKDKVSWRSVCKNPYLPWFERNLLDYWADHIDWLGICLNETLFKQDPDLFDKHIDIWESDKKHFFLFLSRNPFLPWSKELLKKYDKYWYWEDISKNEGIPWSIELIDFFADKLNWGGPVVEYIIEYENGDLTTPIPTKGFEFGFISNNSLPWSIEFLLRFESEIENYSKMQCRAIWEKVFKPVIDDQVLKIVMSLI